MKRSPAAKKLEDGIKETLTPQRGTRIFTNNTIWRLPPEIKRRTKAIGVIPRSFLMLVCAVLRHVAGT